MKFKIPERSERSIAIGRFWRRSSFKSAKAAGVVLLGLVLSSCRSSSPEPVTVTFLDPEWLHDSNTATGGLSGSLQQNRLISDAALLEFTRETGIRVKHLPAPEHPQDQLALDHDLLQERAATPDVYAIDVIWPGILSEYFIDLKSYFTSELPSEHPELVANYTVQGKPVAMWSGSEAVLPAYIIGMVLAGTVGKDHVLIRRLRTLTFGLLTPFYFIRAGSFVSVPALRAAPLVFVALFLAKMISKVVGLFPTVKAFNYQREEGLYFTLMMSTGLTFGTISALFGLNQALLIKRSIRIWWPQ